MKLQRSNEGPLRGPHLSLAVPELGRARPDTPRLPALEALLARGERLPAPPVGWEPLLGALFGLTTTPPVAALCRLADGGGADDKSWVRLDPVHLTADRDRVYLTGYPLALRRHEAERLVAELNAFLSADGLQLEWMHPDRWYLAVPQEEAAVETASPLEALGSDVHDHLPRGTSGRLWRARLTALQMLLHESPVNRERETAGLPAVNSLWVWGAGCLPERGERRWDAVYGEDCLVQGLACWSGVPGQPLPESGRDLADAARGERLLAVLPPLSGQPAAKRLADLEREWLSPLVEELKRGALASLTLFGPHGFAVTAGRGEIRRWWRRRRPLVHYFAPAR